MRAVSNSFLRKILILFAGLAYIGHGGQTHLVFAEGETVSVMICGQGDNRLVEMTFGQDTPPQDTSQDCCGDCHPGADTTALEGAAPYSPALAGLQSLRQVPKTLIGYLRYQLWPGAPPQGPPSI